jgi:hypothetical protein
MEVILSLSDYNMLKDFKTNLEKGNTYRTLDCRQVCGNGSYVYSPTYVSTDEAVKELGEICEIHGKNIEKLKIENSEMRQRILREQDGKRDEILEKVKKMSIWQFLKWKNK